MYKFFFRVFFVIITFLNSTITYAQDSLQKAKPEMAGIMRSNGKIYVVVTVVVIILTGLFFYLVNLDKKISRLENK